MAKKSLEERIQRLEDIHEIQNLMSTYEYLHTAGLQEETSELFAKNTPGASVEIANWGVYEGFEGVKRMYVGVHNFMEGDRTGQMNMHTLTTAIIEVAGDGRTAKAVWISPGHETMKYSGKVTACWAWCKYGVDFIKEDGKWKLWHLHVYGIFHTPYEKSWIESPAFGRPDLPEDLKADKPSSRPFWMYSPDGKTDDYPMPPEPYETWDGKSMA